MTYESLRALLMELTGVGEPDFDPSVDLVDLGLDSMQVFSLVEEWRRAGVHVTFFELAEDPTLDGWWRLLEPRFKARA